MSNKMTDEFYTTLPWRIASRKHSEGFYVIHGKRSDHDELQIVKIHSGPHPDKNHLDRQEDNATAIVSAVNNTYGKSINPEAVGDLLEVAKLYLAELEADDDLDFLSHNEKQILAKIKAALEKATLSPSIRETKFASDLSQEEDHKPIQ